MSHYYNGHGNNYDYETYDHTFPIPRTLADDKNHIIIKVNQVIYILSIIQETARSKRKMHIFTYHIKVSIYTIIE